MFEDAPLGVDLVVVDEGALEPANRFIRTGNSESFSSMQNSSIVKAHCFSCKVKLIKPNTPELPLDFKRVLRVDGPIHDGSDNFWWPGSNLVGSD